MQSLYYKSFNYIETSKPTYLGIYFSLFLHLIILLFAIGLPDFFKPKKIPIPQVIPIEILNISDVTSLKSKKENIEINHKETKKIKLKKFSSSENTEIQKIDLSEKSKKKINTNEKTLDDTEIIKKHQSKEINLKKKEVNNLIEEKKINVNKEVNNLIEEKKINVNNVETLKVNKIKPKLKPKAPEEIKAISDVEIEKKTKPTIKKDDKKIIDKPKPISKPEPDFNIATMLKDLRNEEVSNLEKNNLEEDKKDEKISEEEKTELVDNSELQITLANLAMQQLQGCVSIDSGQLKDNYQMNEPQFIKTKAKYDIDGKVIDNSIQIIDINISNKIKKMIESRVIFALNTCSLSLPNEHYELWKSITMTFDVDKMLNKQ